MDYYFADAHFLPFDLFSSQFTERLVHLPANAPFQPSHPLPPVSELPAYRNGFITFGSFNRVSKLSPTVVKLWASALKDLPTSRLILGAMPRSDEPNPILQWFADEGISSRRLRLHPRSDMQSYLELHGEVDIALDGFPYSGGTTTCYAHWMGVPTLTLAGRTPAGRQAAAMLGYVNLPEFGAHNALEFRTKAVEFASDVERLAAVRAALRDRCTQSPAGQPHGIAEAFERAARTMWRNRCAGDPPRAFVVTMPHVEQAEKPATGNQC
jgi:predicted O-linked N-acetylglucosamine transferase (SPINDLY family)